MDLSKRAANPGLREKRGGLLYLDDSPSGVLGADWSEMVQLRAEDRGDTFNFEGEASVVENPYTVYDMFGEFTETVKEGAFKRTLGENPLVSLVRMHDLGTVMAQTRSGGLDLSADPNLSVRAELDKTDLDVQYVAPKMKRGDMNSMSFAFRVTKQTWNEDYTDREILEVNLHGGDVSVITTGHGANPAAHGALRSIDFAAIDSFLRVSELESEQFKILSEYVAARQADDEDDTPAEVPQSIREDLARLYALDPRALIGA